MVNTEEHPDLERRLEGLRWRPTDDPQVANETRLLVARLEDPDVRASAGRHRRSSRWKLASVLSVCGVLLVAPIAASAAGLFSAQTGVFGGTGTEVVDRSEWIGLHADDTTEAIRALYNDDLSLPEEATPEDVIGGAMLVLGPMGSVPEAESGNPIEQSTTIQFVFENAARCLWYREWLDAAQDDDSTRAATAASGIAEAATWPATQASDGGGVVEALTAEAVKVASGDEIAATRYYERSCQNFYGRIQQ